MNVVVPLGGIGSRFLAEGFTRPKPFIPILGKPMLLWVLDNITLTDDDTLIIVFNPAFMSLGNFMREVVGSQYPNTKFVELDGSTRGAAETVLIGLKSLDIEKGRPTLLLDGDTFYSTDVLSKFRNVAVSHNAIFCFKDTQPNPIYSYVKVDADDGVTEIKEKVKISDFANSGCYCFKDGTQLAAVCEELLRQTGDGELYTSHVIASMLEKGEPFKAIEIDVESVHVLGTPAQVQEFCQTWPTQPQNRFVFDLEGVLVSEERAEPIERNIKMLQRLKKQGHFIIVQSTAPLNAEKKTAALLRRLCVSYDELKLEKPKADFYVGSRFVDALLGDMDKQIGFTSTDIQVAQEPLVLKKPKTTQIGNLTPTSKNVTSVMKVVEDLQEVEELQKSASVKSWEVICGDETGTIVLSVTRAQKDGLVKDKVIMVRNGSIRMVRGHIRLIVDKWGKIDLDMPDPPVIDKVGERNVSATEYVLVSS
eukprot:CAMPEP_0194543030 /NCGR_PEP_ID=MMETSP0253-20130528/85078_1 /TAXON_ID=2966 /ORGANISM="Noctiluca scintillans" /LENGTH=477 /DNA_ID=CAMNT_0039389737 /DNA_START=833 /DNA_END=2266 /DNA_ORIENTATION=+